MASSSSTISATLPSTNNDIGLGLIRRLSQACCATAKGAAQVYQLSHVYDNINFMFKAAEQIIGRKDSQENGTCATAIRLFNANPDDMKTADLLAQMRVARELEITDIVLTHEEDTEYRSLLIHTILRIIVTHGGPSFAKFKDDVAASLPRTDFQIPVHKTDLYPLPAMEIDESSTVGNADVVDAISQSLGYDTKSLDYLRTVKIYSGDQLSMARLRAVENNRAGNDAFHHTHSNIVHVTGHFHGQMHAAAGCLEAHWGHPTAGSRDRGSLCFQNSVIDRKPIVLTSPPPYRTCRDLIFVSLYARMLHCLELVSDTKLQDYASTATFEDLKTDAEAIYDRFVDTTVVDKLRDGTARPFIIDDTLGSPFIVPEIPMTTDDNDPLDGRDVVFENAVLFNRDALIMREYNDGIKAGDSGRIALSMKVLVRYYRGCGRTRYAYETLMSVHNQTCVWPKPLRYVGSVQLPMRNASKRSNRGIVYDNWVVNPTGHDNSFVPLDLVQEHHNFWIKVRQHVFSNIIREPSTEFCTMLQV